MAQRERLLARDGELVLREVLPRRRAVARSRTRIPEVELDVVHVHALAQNLQDAELLDLRGDLLRHVLVERSLSPVRLQPVGLRRLQERPQPPRVYGKRLVHVRRLAPEELLSPRRLRRHVGTRAAFLARGPDKRLLDLPLERLLIRHARAHATFTFPVTTSSMTICRRSRSNSICRRFTSIARSIFPVSRSNRSTIASCSGSGGSEILSRNKSPA